MASDPSDWDPLPPDAAAMEVPGEARRPLSAADGTPGSAPATGVPAHGRQTGHPAAETTGATTSVTTVAEPRDFVAEGDPRVDVPLAVTRRPGAAGGSLSAVMRRRKDEPIQREQEYREQVQREQAQREQAQREPAQREQPLPEWVGTALSPQSPAAEAETVLVAEPALVRDGGASAGPHDRPLRRASAEFRAAVVAPVLAPGQDPREVEPWFLAIPLAEQRRLREAWAAETSGIRQVGPHAAAILRAAAGGNSNRSQELLERFWVAYVVFFLAALPLMLTEGLAGFVRMAMAGCVTGVVWQLVPYSRFACVASAVAVYLGVVVAPRLAELWETPFDLLVSLCGAALVGYLASLGALHEEKQLAAQRT